MEKKKNSKHYIIPPSYFKNKGITPVPVQIPKKTETNQAVPEVKDKPKPATPDNTSNFAVNEPPKIVLKKETKRASGLSLSSIKAKKEHLIKQMDVIVDEQDLPKEPFTEQELIKTWKAFITILEAQGKRNLASILSIDTPKLKGTTIHLEFPNDTNKVEVERQQYDLLSYLRKSLNNFDIDLSIDVNEVMEKKYAYTTREKFEKLKEKNPSIDVLRKTFDLDI